MARGGLPIQAHGVLIKHTKSKNFNFIPKKKILVSHIAWKEKQREEKWL